MHVLVCREILSPTSSREGSQWSRSLSEGCGFLLLGAHLHLASQMECIICSFRNSGGLGIVQEGKARLQQCSTFGLRLSLACGPCPHCWGPKLGCRAHWVRWELAGVLHQLRSLWHAEGWNGKWQCYSNPSLKCWVAVPSLDWSASPQRLPVCKAVNSTSLS